MDYLVMQPDWVDDVVLDMINEDKVFVRRNTDGEQYLLMPKMIPVESVFDFDQDIIFIPEE